MKRQQFSYDLPEELIASQPAATRGGSRLLKLDGTNGAVSHHRFPDLLAWLQPGDLMVFNDTRVIPARLFARKPSGGKVEVLVERILDDHSLLAQVRASKAPKSGSCLILDNGTEVEVQGRREEFFVLAFAHESPIEVLERSGHMPLPPYIQRAADESDTERYQTVYGKVKGAVAAPTAGLHFDEDFIAQIVLKGVETAHVTLHVGAGTFQPMRVDDIVEHRMHSEVMELCPDVCEQIQAAKREGRRVIAVGTTTVRCLESAARGGELQPFQGETNIFIFPTFQFRVVDALITNFHLPESTLLMLVCAFAGYEETMQAYRTAVAEKYRFFSYGDAMFINRNSHPSLPIVDTA